MTAMGAAGFTLTFLLAKGLNGARMVNHPGGEQPPSYQPTGCGGGGREPSGAAQRGSACRAVEAEGMAPAAPGGVGRGGNAEPEAAECGRGAGGRPSARTSGKGTVSPESAGARVDPAEEELWPQPCYFLAVLFLLPSLVPFSPFGRHQMFLLR